MTRSNSLAGDCGVIIKMIKISKNKLKIGNFFVSDLIKKFGSPLYIYDEETIRQKYRDLYKNIKYKPLRIYYACKANTNLSILKILKEEGACIDAVSPGEILAALSAGYKPEQILFTGNNLTDDEMRFAINEKVMINIDSLSQLRRYGMINPGSRISVRINPDVGAGHHEHTITGGPDSKFGIYFDKVGEIKTIAQKHKLKIVGIHEHIGSGILDTNKFLLAMKVLLKTARKFENLEFIDFGGGIGVPYRKSQKAIDMSAFGKKVSELFEKFCKEHGKKLTMTIEPGRYLVCESGILACTVNTIKTTPKHKFIGVDSGFNHLIRPMAYGSYHEIIAADNVNSAKKENALICGNLCESGDIFTRNEQGIEERSLPVIEEGDVLAIMNAGAYGFSMSSNYNLRLKPMEILINGNKARAIRNKDSYNDLLKGMKL